MHTKGVKEEVVQTWGRYFVLVFRQSCWERHSQFVSNLCERVTERNLMFTSKRALRIVPPGFDSVDSSQETAKNRDSAARQPNAVFIVLALVRDRSLSKESGSAQHQPHSQDGTTLFQRGQGGGGRKIIWLHPRGNTPIYFLYRDVPTVGVSFSGSSVLNRVYNFTYSCLTQGRPRKSSPFLPLRSHNFRWFRAPSLKCVKTQTYALGESWTVTYHFLLDRVAKFPSFVSWTGSGFRWVGRTPLPKFLLSTPPPPGGSITSLTCMIK